jgi:hypothetical protein
VDDEVHKAKVALQCSADDDVGRITHHSGGATCNPDNTTQSQRYGL